MKIKFILALREHIAKSWSELKALTEQWYFSSLLTTEICVSLCCIQYVLFIVLRIKFLIVILFDKEVNHCRKLNSML